MDFKIASKLGSLISKEYAKEFFILLLKYKSISASEAASRLSQHIKTAQDFLEGLELLKIVSKEEVYERKRPYFRYKLEKKDISLNFDLRLLYNPEIESLSLRKKIKERKNSGAMFTTAGSSPVISSVSIWEGEARNRKERKISLTTVQGKFLYHLPFPSAEFNSVSEIMIKAKIDSTHSSEIVDIVEMLEKNSVVESEV